MIKIAGQISELMSRYSEVVGRLQALERNQEEYRREYIDELVRTKVKQSCSELKHKARKDLIKTRHHLENAKNSIKEMNDKLNKAKQDAAETAQKVDQCNANLDETKKLWFQAQEELNDTLSVLDGLQKNEESKVEDLIGTWDMDRYENIEKFMAAAGNVILVN